MLVLSASIVAKTTPWCLANRAEPSYEVALDALRAINATGPVGDNRSAHVWRGPALVKTSLRFSDSAVAPALEVRSTCWCCRSIRGWRFDGDSLKLLASCRCGDR